MTARNEVDVEIVGKVDVVALAERVAVATARLDELRAASDRRDVEHERRLEAVEHRTTKALDGLGRRADALVTERVRGLAKRGGAAGGGAGLLWVLWELFNFLGFAG